MIRGSAGWLVVMTVVVSGLPAQIQPPAPLDVLLPNLDPRGGFDRGMVVADVDGDGREDLVGTVGTEVRLARGLSSAFLGISAVASYPAGSAPRVAAVEDVDGDGFRDLLLVVLLPGAMPATVAFELRRNDGTGSFPTAEALVGPPGAIGGSLFARRGSGVGSHRDVQVVAITGGGLHTTRNVFEPSSGMWLASADGALDLPADMTVNPVDMRQGDLDGDGVPELIGVGVTTPRVGFPVPTDVVIYAGMTTGSGVSPTPWMLQRPGSMSAPALPVPLVIDVDRDGLDDLVIVDRSDSLVPMQSILVPSALDLHVASGSTVGLPSVWGPGQAMSRNLFDLTGGLRLGDVDGDGIVDLVARLVDPSVAPPLVAPDLLEFRRGLGDGTFGAPIVFEPRMSDLEGFELADTDGDGERDLIAFDLDPLHVARGIAFAGDGLADAAGQTPGIGFTLRNDGPRVLKIALRDAEPGRPVVLAVAGADRIEPSLGAVVDLSALLWPLGAIGPSISATDGSAALEIPLPLDPALSGATVYAQWAVGASTPAGLALSPRLRITL